MKMIIKTFGDYEKFCPKISNLGINYGYGVNFSNLMLNGARVLGVVHFGDFDDDYYCEIELQ